MKLNKSTRINLIEDMIGYEINLSSISEIIMELKILQRENLEKYTDAKLLLRAKLLGVQITS